MAMFLCTSFCASAEVDGAASTDGYFGDRHGGPIEDINK